MKSDDNEWPPLTRFGSSDGSLSCSLAISRCRNLRRSFDFAEEAGLSFGFDGMAITVVVVC